MSWRGKECVCPGENVQKVYVQGGQNVSGLDNNNFYVLERKKVYVQETERLYMSQKHMSISQKRWSTG